LRPGLLHPEAAISPSLIEECRESFGGASTRTLRPATSPIAALLRARVFFDAEVLRLVRGVVD
jgi:hypothetical protein